MESLAQIEEKKAAQAEVQQKHDKLADEDARDVVNTVELLENKYTQNVAQPFISQSKVWDDDETFAMPDDIQQNIINNLGFRKPSIIQSLSIPLIRQEPYTSLIAQARNGAGKTGSFAIGSALRVERDNPRPQVLVITHTRELCNQVSSVYEKIIKGTGITLTNMTENAAPAQIMVGTHGKIEVMTNGRKTLDLSCLKCLVIDESDVFFLDDKNFETLSRIANSRHIKDNEAVQWVLFSATYPPEDNDKYEAVQRRVSDFIKKAAQIKIKAEKLKLPNIRQFTYRCEPRTKLDFIKEVFETCEMTQTFIFVNTKDFAEKVHFTLRKAGYASHIMFSKMAPAERDETIRKFRDTEINVLITTNMIARGIDVPETQLVINYDVPSQRVPGGKEHTADAENYLHRIGRTGRFGTNGVALTIYDRDVDKQYIDEIVDHYQIQDIMEELEGPEQLKDVLRNLQAD